MRSHDLNRLPQAIRLILTPWCTLLRFVALLCLRVRVRLGGFLARFSTRCSWLPKSQLNTLDGQRNSRSSCALTFGNSFWKKSVSLRHLELWTAPSSCISLIGWLVWEFPCWNQKLFILFVWRGAQKIRDAKFQKTYSELNFVHNFCEDQFATQAGAPWAFKG